MWEIRWLFPRVVRVLTTRRSMLPASSSGNKPEMPETAKDGSKNRHRRRAMDLTPPMKTGLNWQNRAGIITLFHPVLHPRRGIFLFGNVGLPPGLRRGWDIPVKKGDHCSTACFCAF